MPKAFVHLYGKLDTKPGRKMGHINVLANTREELMDELVKIKRMVKVIAE
jgi:5-(carboxyamino)imidazole ribonucleotide synthase